MTTRVFYDGEFQRGDCLDLMPEIADHSVDLVLCDLPYSTTACEWDALIPFEPLWVHYRRIAKPKAAIVLTAQQPFTTKLIASNLLDYRYSWVWEKDQGTNFLNAKRQPMKVHEDICVFYREQPTYNPQMTVGRPYTSGPGTSGDVTGNVTKTITNNGGTRYPRSVQRFTKERGLHPTQKPTALFEYIIRTYTDPGQTVLDNCAGSGTTAVAARRADRRWICIERDAEYFARAIARLE